MDGYKNIEKNQFVIEVLRDGNSIFSDIEFDANAIELPKDTELSEYQYYIHNVGFYLIHTITWCKQLDLSIDFLTNFNYSKKNDSNRADHLIYNIENYLIRLNSVYDRVLQIINAVFHLCINEQNVNHSIIVSNYKVQHRSSVVLNAKKIRKYLNDYAQARHTLIHKHSWLDLKLRKIQLFYLNKFDDPSQSDEMKTRLKHWRAKFLKEYIVEKKTEFKKINSDLANQLYDLFDSLLDVYNLQKRLLG